MMHYHHRKENLKSKLILLQHTRDVDLCEVIQKSDWNYAADLHHDRAHPRGYDERHDLPAHFRCLALGLGLHFLYPVNTDRPIIMVIKQSEEGQILRWKGFRLTRANLWCPDGPYSGIRFADAQI